VSDANLTPFSSASPQAHIKWFARLKISAKVLLVILRCICPKNIGGVMTALTSPQMKWTLSAASSTNKARLQVISSANKNKAKK
jgi:folylpolyglutamate synthase/dihydropteroate synthase